MKTTTLQKKTVLIILCYLIGFQATSSKAEIRKLAKYFVTAEVIATESYLLRDASIEFQVYKDSINSDYTTKFDIYKHKINGTRFFIRIPLDGNLNYGRIKYITSAFENEEYNVLNQSNNLFIFQSGDDIKIYIGSKNVIFEGIGSEKYNCLFGLTKISYDVFKKPKILPGQYEYEAILDSQKEISDSIYLVKQNFLDNFKTRIAPEVYDLTAADCWGEYNDKIIGSFVIGTDMGDMRNVNDEAINKSYFAFIRNFDHTKYNDQLLAKSFKYCDFLIKKERFSVMFCFSPKQGYYNKQFTFEQMFQSILKSYNGLVLDKVILLSFIVESSLGSKTADAYPEAIKKIGNNNFRNYMLEIERNNRGDAFSFELPDEKGKIHKLNDFKGKVIVMDFWFTGCSGCRKLAVELKPIISSYKLNPNIVFISISIDGEKYKKQWLNSLQKEIYSSKEEINLLAPKDRNSEIIKHYNILAYPTVIIISKDGKIISTSPPLPRGDKPETVKEFKDFLNEYI